MKIRLFLMVLLTAFCLSADSPLLEPKVQETPTAEEPYCAIYEHAVSGTEGDRLETVRSIVEAFGANGYPAVESKNQIDMAGAEQVIQFCQKTDTGEEAEITILAVRDEGGFISYDLQTSGGSVDVVRTYYMYEDEKLQKASTGSYTAEDWQYTEDGYLMFSGTWFSEELYALTLSETEEQVAFRVKPLDETCRELNRKYLLPIGYEENNMFLTDWNEADFKALNFYDVYDRFYPCVKGQPVPYVMDENLGVGASYQIPAEEFEAVIRTYFNIDRDTLRSKTIYNAEDDCYEYRPRGFYEVEYPEYPYSEVVAFEENGDGTITLTVHVVFPYMGSSNVYTHEVVVRPLEDEGVQYVSNRVTDAAEHFTAKWHTPRLNEEAWEELYGGCE